MRRRNAGVTLACLVLVCLLSLFARPAAADVLVAKGGKVFEGTITEDGNSYILVLPKGGKMRFPKSNVEKVIRQQDLEAEFDTRAKAADLNNDRALRDLLDFAKKWKLEERFQPLLLKAFARRADQADLRQDNAVKSLVSFAKEWRLEAEQAAMLGKALAQRAAKVDLQDDAALTALVSFCKEWKLESGRRAVLTKAYAARLAKAGESGDALRALAQWCSAQGLNEEGAQCSIRAIQADAKQKRVGAAEAAKALLQLAEDCNKRGLPARADEAKAAALAAAPDAPAVRGALGYAWDEDKKTWTVPWRVRVIEARLGTKIEESALSEENTITVSGAGMALAQIKVAFTALAPEKDAALAFEKAVNPIVAAYAKESQAREEQLKRDLKLKLPGGVGPASAPAGVGPGSRGPTGDATAPPMPPGGGTASRRPKSVGPGARPPAEAGPLPRPRAGVGSMPSPPAELADLRAESKEIIDPAWGEAGALAMRFLSGKDVKLRLTPGGRELPLSFMAELGKPAAGWTHFGQSSSYQSIKTAEPPILRYFRKADAPDMVIVITGNPNSTDRKYTLEIKVPPSGKVEYVNYLLVRANAEVQLTLLYVVPADSSGGTLQFCNCAPIEVKFQK